MIRVGFVLENLLVTADLVHEFNSEPYWNLTLEAEGNTKQFICRTEEIGAMLFLAAVGDDHVLSEHMYEILKDKFDHLSQELRPIP